MAKYKRTVIGSLCKGQQEKDSNGNPLFDKAGKPVLKPDYIKINTDITLKKDDFLNLESKKSQLESLDAAMKSGKLSEEVGLEIRAKVENIPDFVRFQVVRVEKQ